MRVSVLGPRLRGVKMELHACAFEIAVVFMAAFFFSPEPDSKIQVIRTTGTGSQITILWKYWICIQNHMVPIMFKGIFEKSDLLSIMKWELLESGQGNRIFVKNFKKEFTGFIL